MQATLEWENQEDGFLAKILVGDGSKDIPVGTPVAVITEEKDDVSFLHRLHTVVHFCHTQRMPEARSLHPLPHSHVLFMTCCSLHM